MAGGSLLLVARIFILGVSLVAYGNLGALVLGTATPVGPWPGVFLGMLLMISVVAWSCLRSRVGLEELGLATRGFLPSTGLGLLVALATALPALLFLRFPPLLGTAVEYPPLGSMPPDALLWRSFVWMPLDTAIPEEVAFRGVLLAMLLRRSSTMPAVVLSALVFTGWHAVIVSRTVALTNLQSEPLLSILGLVGAFLAVFAGGLLFAWLRVASGNLAGSIVAHWAFNTLLLLGLANGV